MKDTVKIGICGRSGSGKSYVCSVFSSFGGLHIDTDKVYHDLLEPRRGRMSACAAKIVSVFGDEVADGTRIDRKRLGAIVFSDPEKLVILNRTVHPYILRKTKKLVAECEKPFALIDAPVLFESGFDRFCDFTVAVVADDETCISRIAKRDGISEEEALKRLSSQISKEELIEKCDFSVNNSAHCDVTPQVKELLSKTGLINGKDQR